MCDSSWGQAECWTGSRAETLAICALSPPPPHVLLHCTGPGTSTITTSTTTALHCATSTTTMSTTCTGETICAALCKQVHRSSGQLHMPPVNLWVSVSWLQCIICEFQSCEFLCVGCSNVSTVSFNPPLVCLCASCSVLSVSFNPPLNSLFHSHYSLSSPLLRPFNPYMFSEKYNSHIRNTVGSLREIQVTELDKYRWQK